MKSSLFYISAILFFLITSCDGNRTESGADGFFELTGEAQGSTFSIKYFSRDQMDLSNDIKKTFDDFDKELSLWDDQSIISRFNQFSDSTDAFVSQGNYFNEVYSKAMEICSLTDGNFNPLVKPLVNYWGFFKEKGYQEEPEPDKIDSLRALISPSFLEAEDKGNGLLIRKKEVRVSLDLNAIAQGASVDILAQLLEEKGVEDYMIEVGGEVRTKGKNPQGKIWRIGIDRPLENTESRELHAVVELENRAMATSGNYRKFYEKDGVKYSHTIDPMSGYPVTHRLLSVTVIANDCATADALATAFMVMGEEKTLQFVSNHPELQLEVYLISSDEKGGYLERSTQGMEKILKEL